MKPFIVAIVAILALAPTKAFACTPVPFRPPCITPRPLPRPLPLPQPPVAAPRPIPVPMPCLPKPVPQPCVPMPCPPLVTHQCR